MTLEMLDRYLRDLEANDAFSGVVRVTVGEDERFSGAYGFASRAWGARNTMDTRFDTASITKLFTAGAALQQVGGGTWGGCVYDADAIIGLLEKGKRAL